MTVPDSLRKTAYRLKPRLRAVGRRDRLLQLPRATPPRATPDPGSPTEREVTLRSENNTVNSKRVCTTTVKPLVLIDKRARLCLLRLSNQNFRSCDGRVEAAASWQISICCATKSAFENDSQHR